MAAAMVAMADMRHHKIGTVTAQSLLRQSCQRALLPVLQEQLLDPCRRVQRTFPLSQRGRDTPAISLSLQTLNLRQPASSELQVQDPCVKDCGQLHLFQWFSPSQFFCRTRRHPAILEGTDPICTQKAHPSWRPASQWWDMPEMLGTQDLHLFVYSHPYASYVLNLLPIFQWLLPVHYTSLKTDTGQCPLCVNSTCVQRSDFNSHQI